MCYPYMRTKSSRLKKHINIDKKHSFFQLFALENISVLLCYVAFVFFRHSKQMEIVTVYKKKEHSIMTVENCV